MTEGAQHTAETADSSVSDRPQPARPRRTWIWFAAILAALAVLVGLVWVAGGFDQRTDVRTAVPPGTTIATGPYEFTFDSATVQKKKDYDGTLSWEVVVVGSGRVTGDQAMGPSTLDSFFAAREPVSGQVVEPKDQQYGPPGRPVGGSFFTPGLAPVAYRLVFEFPIERDQPRSVDLAVWELEYRDTTLLKTGELSWARASDYYWYDSLVTKRLADDLD